jgi:hypothetical protein
MQKQKKQSFNQILLSAIDESLFALGEDIKLLVYLHLDETYHMKREQIPSKIEEFSDALEKIFGVGARYLEILFMQQLYLKLKEKTKLVDSPELSVSELKFADYIKVMREKYKDVLSV